MDKHLTGTHDQVSKSDPAKLALALLAISRPVPGQSKAAIMDFIAGAQKSDWYQQIKFWLVERPAFDDDRVVALFDRGCQFIVDIIGWRYDEGDWWGLEKMAKEPLVNLSNRIVLAVFTVGMRDRLGVDDPCLIGLEIFTEIVLRARWESYYKDMAEFLRQHYSNDSKFSQSLLDCDEKMQNLQKTVLEKFSRSGL